MLSYIVRRVWIALLTALAITAISFAIIQLPEGDYMSSYIAMMAAMGTEVTRAEADTLRVLYSLDKPMYAQYLRWMGLMAHGNFGMSMEWRRPVLEVIGDRLSYEIPEMINRNSKEVDLDLSEAIMDLKMYEYTHKAALQTAGRILQPTLLDFLR